jgi:hypothetical protein
LKITDLPAQGAGAGEADLTVYLATKKRVIEKLIESICEAGLNSRDTFALTCEVGVTALTRGLLSVPPEHRPQILYKLVAEVGRRLVGRSRRGRQRR